MRLIWAFLLACLLSCYGQEQFSEKEQADIRRAVGEAGNSPVELMRALETHLAKYPNSPRRAELERALARAAIENKDNRRIMVYGEKVLARDPGDAMLLENVARALLGSGDEAGAQRALKYAKRLEQGARALETEKMDSAREEAQKRVEMDRVLGKALVYQARATGNLGKMAEAVALARASHEAHPTSESAREIARWLERSGKVEEALPHLADAFMIADAGRTEADQARDRARLGELYRKLKGTDAGLGDLVLEAYDRTTGLLALRRLKLKLFDPNAQVTNPLEFTVSSVKGDKLPLASLKGKVLVLDFWATWCGPCRGQHPLYDQVKQRFKDRNDLVFLSINTDEDRSLVEPFLNEMKWSKTVYFEDGLSAALRVNSIPTTVIFNKRGDVFSRMNGYIPERFVDMLTQRLREALKE